VLRRIFGPKRDEVTGGWRKLHNEELRNLYSSPSIIRMIKSEWVGGYVGSWMDGIDRSLSVCEYQASSSIVGPILFMFRIQEFIFNGSILL
jgi:hypothetical protein